MAYPSNATERMAYHYLIYGDVWDAFVNDAYESESELGIDDNIEIAAPLLLLWSSTSRVVNGHTLSPGGPGLGTHTWTEQGVTMTRWVRVVNRPEDCDDGVAMDGPLRMAADGTNDPASAWFDINSWTETLPEVGWGGSEVQLTVHDPSNIYAGIFTTGRAISIYVEEYENGSFISGRESFSGFVLETENDDMLVDHVYTFRAGSAIALFQMPGKDGRASIFLDETFHNSTGAVDPGTLTITPPATELLASNFAHIIFNLTAGKAIAHLMLWHMWVRVSGTTYRLMQLIDWRRDYWNDPSEDDMYIPAVGIREGNLAQRITDLIPQEVYRAYCDYRSGIVVTIDHEFKPSPDTPLDTIDMNYVYAVRELGGQDNTVGQVQIPQAPITATEQFDRPQMFSHPTTAIAERSIYRPVVSFLVSRDAGGTIIAKGLFDKHNSQKRRLVHVPGAKWSLHNLMTIDGDDWMVERVIHPVNGNELGGHETMYTVRRVVIS